VPLIGGIRVTGESKQVTTIVTTTKTTYKLIEQSGDEDDYEFVEIGEAVESPPAEGEIHEIFEEFELVKEGSESSISSPSEDEEKSLLSGGHGEKDDEIDREIVKKYLIIP
jgi:hypothetical protein